MIKKLKNNYIIYNKNINIKGMGLDKKKVGLFVKKKFKKKTFFLKFSLDMYVGNLYLLKSSPGANMEQIPGNN